MASTHFAWLKKIGLVVVWLISLCYVGSSLAYYIPPSNGLVFSLLALPFPYFFIALVCLILIYCFTNKKISLVLIAISFLGFKSITSCLALNWKSRQNRATSNTQTIRLLSWNVNHFGEQSRYAKKASDTAIRVAMMQFIQQQQPDVICLQDEVLQTQEKYWYNDLHALNMMSYHYSYLSKDKYRVLPDGDTTQIYGSIILSKTPLKNCRRIPYPLDSLYESLILAETTVKGKTFTLSTTHLRSLALNLTYPENKQEFSMLGKLDSSMVYNKGTIYKLGYFDQQHVKQANIVKQALQQINMPHIFCADLNSVPSSYVYHQLSSGYQDAFLAKGFGFGKTYYRGGPTMRIDVTLFSPQFTIQHYFSPQLPLSDHYPIVVDFVLP